MQIFFQPTISFKATPKEDFDTSLKTAVRNYLTNQTDQSTEELFSLVDPKFKENSKGNNVYSAEDVYQEKVLAFFELLPNLKDEKEPCEAIKKIIETNPENKKTASISTPVSYLGPNIDLVKQYYGIGTERKNYREIAEDNDICFSNASKKVRLTILNAQINEGEVPVDIQDKMDQFKENVLRGIIPDEELDKTVNNLFLSNLILQTYPTSRITQNINSMVNSFKDEGLTEKDYLKACIKKPALFSQLPETLERNIRELVKRFEDEGLDVKDYLKASLKQPQLFYQSPDTIETNVRGMVERFKDEGLTTQDYLKACVKFPALFYQSTDSMENKVRGLVERFKEDGLTTEDYLKVCVKQPSMFCQLPDRIEYNIRTLVNRFEKDGLKTDCYLEAAKKQPAVFVLSPENLERKIKFNIFKRKCEAFIKNNPPIDVKNSWNLILAKLYPSEDSICLYLLNTLMFDSINQTKIRENKLTAGMPEYLRNHPDDEYNIRVLNDNEIAPEFVKFVDKYSKSVLGKNVFHIELVNPTDKN